MLAVQEKAGRNASARIRISAISVICAMVLFLTACGANNNEVNQMTNPAMTHTEPERIETVPQTVPTEEKQQPELLASLLSANQSDFETLELSGCTQLVTVCANGTEADIRFFEAIGGQWTEVVPLFSRGYVGRGGVSTDKREGDGCTPTGLYSIGSAFYIDDMPQTGLDIFRIQEETYWVDDPDSRFYNQRVEGTENKDWNSAEHMIRHDVYRYGFVVNYNTEAIPGAGSAIFFHVHNAPTAGCIVTDEKMVCLMLAELDQTRNPHILIVDGNRIP